MLVSCSLRIWRALFCAGFCSRGRPDEGQWSGSAPFNRLLLQDGLSCLKGTTRSHSRCVQRKARTDMVTRDMRESPTLRGS